MDESLTLAESGDNLEFGRGIEQGFVEYF